MTFAELKAAVLKVKAAVESRDPLAAFSAVAEIVKLAGEFFGQPVPLLAAEGGADLTAEVTALKAACDECDATPKFGGGLWGALVLKIVTEIIDRLRKK